MDLHRPLSVWRVYDMMAATLRRAIGGALTLAQWLANAEELNRAFRDSPRKKRRSQATRAVCLFLGGLALDR